jgi:membrane peptidoglycan carboxypeptidase
VRLIDIVAAYCAIARNGTYRAPHLIRGVEFRDHTFAPLGAFEERLVIDDSSACNAIRYALSAAGLATLRTVWAGKSGTTKDSSLYVGYNDHVSAAILVGFRSPQLEKNPKGVTASQILDRIGQALLGHRSDLLSI